MTREESVYFRAGVGALITDGLQERVLLFQRRDYPDNWQCPQGGLNPGETFLDALFREIREETGIEAKELTVLATHPVWLGYDFSFMLSRSGPSVGQVHRWYILQFNGVYDTFRTVDHDEFINFSWFDISSLPDKVPFFKKELSKILVDWFQTVTGSPNKNFPSDV